MIEASVETQAPHPLVAQGPRPPLEAPRLCGQTLPNGSKGSLSGTRMQEKADDAEGNSLAPGTGPLLAATKLDPYSAQWGLRAPASGCCRLSPEDPFLEAGGREVLERACSLPSVADGSEGPTAFFQAIYCHLPQAWFTSAAESRVIPIWKPWRPFFTHTDISHDSRS